MRRSLLAVWLEILARDGFRFELRLKHISRETNVVADAFGNALSYDYPTDRCV